MLKGRDEMNWDRGGEWDAWISGFVGTGQRLRVPNLAFLPLPFLAPSAIINPKQSKDAPKSFTFDYSYWSHTSVRLLGWGKAQLGS